MILVIWVIDGGQDSYKQCIGIESSNLRIGGLGSKPILEKYFRDFPLFFGLIVCGRMSFKDLKNLGPCFEVGRKIRGPVYILHL